MSGSFSEADVKSHNKPDSLWIIVDEDVYDLTKFQVSASDRMEIKFFALTNYTG